MSKSVSVDKFEQAMVRLAMARLHIAVAVLTSAQWDKGVPVEGSATSRAIAQIQAAISELETNLPFTTKGKP
jgi:hypothetical protein